ncbi:hypothetical protein ETB97_007094 [Aspergillus alliaceus]|uniref:Uncharacterized protein n=1 Tax=Petromyces alliaceus TaxID=209559 RepID=A0A8H6E202_PETAA|nr:hypothetical protein ETB97_007094 [Aspergillus burnettii]
MRSVSQQTILSIVDRGVEAGLDTNCAPWGHRAKRIGFTDRICEEIVIMDDGVGSQHEGKDSECPEESPVSGEEAASRKTIIATLCRTSKEIGSRLLLKERGTGRLGRRVNWIMNLSISFVSSFGKISTKHTVTIMTKNENQADTKNVMIIF